MPPAGLIGRGRRIWLSPARRSPAWYVGTIVLILHPLVCAVGRHLPHSLHTNEAIATKLDEPMNFGYGFDAIDAARKDQLASIMSTAYDEGDS